jgi:hypothetical protein
MWSPSYLSYTSAYQKLFYNYRFDEYEHNRLSAIGRLTLFAAVQRHRAANGAHEPLGVESGEAERNTKSDSMRWLCARLVLSYRVTKLDNVFVQFAVAQLDLARRHLCLIPREHSLVEFVLHMLSVAFFIVDLTCPHGLYHVYVSRTTVPMC